MMGARTKQSQSHSLNQNGFTLIEVMITLGILLALVIAISSTLRSSIDVKQALARESRVTHRLSLAMAKMTGDIEQTFITGLNDEHRGGANRRFKTVFKIEKGESDKLFLTMMGRKQSKSEAKEGDTAYVVYEVRESKDVPGRKHLYRGISALTLEDLKQDPPMKLFVRNIKSFKVIPWKGDDWSSDRWDSSRGDWRDKLPQMVKLEIETWGEGDNEVAADTPAEQRQEGNIVSVKTVVRIQQSRNMKELRQPMTTMRLF